MCRYGNKHTDDLYSHGVQMMPIYMLHDEKVLFEATANQAACAYIYIYKYVPILYKLLKTWSSKH